MLAWSAATWSAIAAIGGAVAAVAACAAVVVDILRQRDARKPNVSAGYLSVAPGQDCIEFVNGGPGVAVALGYFGVDGQHKYGGMVGTGHLVPGTPVRMAVVQVAQAATATFVWVCRDTDVNEHVWSYDGRYVRNSRRKVLKRAGKGHTFGDAFLSMYPEVPIPP